MASAVHSICFSRDSNIILYRESCSSSSKLFTRSGNWPHGDVGKVKLWSNSEGLRSNRFEQSRRNCFWMKSRASHLVLCRIENIVPVHNTEAKEDALSPIAIVLNAVKKWRQVPFMALAGAFACMVLVVPSSDAVDTLKTFGCLLKECRMEFAKCISNPSCAANIACLETCNNRPDEIECEYKCGEMFENSVVHEFNQCAVSRKKCVPQKSDLGEFLVPNPAVLVKSFNIADFNGKWYITSGLNPTFDTFDCQWTEFHKESNKLVGNLSWRISTPDGGFFNKSTVQQFVQDAAHPGILYNHDNEYLHYKDNWYILSSKIENKPDDYIFVYYRGGNDAWDGYGGGVVYTRSEVLPENIVPELEKAAKSVGRDFNKFIRTDNTCGPEPSFVEKMEKKAGEGGEFIIREAKEIEKEVEKVWEDEMTYFQRLAEGFKEQNQDGNSLRAW